MKPSKSLLLTCALCASAFAVNAELRAGDSIISAAPVKAAIAPPDYKGPVEYEAKVMVVNRPEKTITVQINDKLHLFKLGPQTRLLRKGKPVSLLELTPGKRITVVASTQDDGALQLVAMSLDGSLAEAQPAGPTAPKVAKGTGDAGSGGVAPTKTAGGAPNLPPPFQGGYFPGHVEKVVVSPND